MAKPRGNKMIKKGLISLFFLLLVFSAGLQAQFARTYGGQSDDFPGRILTTPDGGFIVFGNWGGESFTSWPWLIKLAADGTVEWEKAYGGSNNGSRHTFCGTPDGGYLLVGGTNNDIWLIKTDSLGEPAWEASIVNNGYSYEWPPYSVCPAGDSGYFIVGSTMVGANVDVVTTDVWVNKVSSDGSLVWQKTYGLGGWELGLGAEATADGGCVIAGMTGETEYARYDGQPIVFKIDALGALSWQKKFSVYTPYTRAELGSIRGTDEAGYTLTGTMFKGSNYEAYPAGFVFNIGVDGTLVWSKSIGRGLNDSWPIKGGGSIVVGTFGTADETDILVMKLLANGDVEWTKAFGGSLKEEGSTVVQTVAGDYAIAGTTISFGAGAKDICVLRISSDGGLGTCRFSKGAIGGAAARGVSEANISLATGDTSVAIQATDIGVSDTSGISRNYQLCAEKKLLTICATDTSLAATATTPSFGTYLYDAGESATISATTSLTDSYGYTCNFSGWGGDATGSANPITVTVNEDMTVQAKYAIDWGGDGGGGGDGNGGGGGCFIATAAYRSPLHPAVRLLQDFRDKRLLTNAVGRVIVAAYYRSSPAAARLVSRSAWLRLLARILLVPVIAVAAMVLKLGWIPALLLMAAATALAFRRVRLKLRGGHLEA
jgi:hypothetical protein